MNPDASRQAFCMFNGFSEAFDQFLTEGLSVAAFFVPGAITPAQAERAAR
jgi:hypothetical protein